MAITFKFHGTQNTVVSENYIQLRSVQPSLQVVEYTAVSVRSAAFPPSDITVEEDDLVVMKMSNDVEWHYRADDFKSFLESQVSGTRGEGMKEPLEIPPFVVPGDGTRGAEEIITTKGIKVITGMVAKGAAKLLANHMEKDLDTGLHKCNANLDFEKFDKKVEISSKPYLLFIHGTNSNTAGAFGGLKGDAYNKLFAFYEGRVLAFEHKTLTESPVKNVTDLLNALPAGITVDVVSHSRGGIVADLLARCSGGELPFNDAEMELINSNKAFISLKPEAEEANKAAAGKHLSVAKLVRVACPAAGTVLIEDRLDNLVNILCNLLKLIPGAALCMPFTIFLEFAKAVVHERTDVAVFPGLEAQIPNSPLMRILNNPEREISSELFVISGDVESAGIFKTLMVITTNLYFGEAHDYVVNSNSMFKGTYRRTNVREYFGQESNVNHFNYFKNPKSQKALLAALINFSEIDSYYEKLGITSEITKSHSRGDTGTKPLLYILPGIMGSQLKVGTDLVWADFFKISRGRLSELDISNNKVKLDILHGKTYNSLINYFSTDFDVIEFPYDWRKSITEAGQQLSEDLKKRISDKGRTSKEIRFIAHSMGGLVLRAMIHQKDSPWSTITQSYKPKVIMMGVPNEGSYGTIRILLGKDSIINKLALLDFSNSKKGLLDIFRKYPALIQLLPAKHSNIFKSTLWKTLEQAKNDFTAPGDELLTAGANFYKSIDNTVYDNNIFRYIAGHDDQTPNGFAVENNKISFTATSQGDGRVLWDTIPGSLLPENIYYVPATHGDIPKHEDSFAGFKEILTKGNTNLLSNIRPATRSVDHQQKMPDSDIVTIPSLYEFDETLLGTTKKTRKPTKLQRISISVTNGDLVHSKYPVVVGHFMGDGIIYAEKYLNKALNYKLSEYHLAGNYPGEIGTHLVVLKNSFCVSENIQCEGAVVVGLGDFGALTENRLVLSLTQAFLTLAIKFKELVKGKKGSEQSIFGISSLLVGSDFAGLRISTSVKAILTAVMQTNEKLEAMDASDYPKINHVEFIEIYQHKAIQIGRIVNRFMQEDAFANFIFSPCLMKTGSGLLRVIADENQQDIWHRLEISVVKNDREIQSNKRTLPIRFISITDKAHADKELLPTNRLIVESLIQKIARHSEWNKSFSQTLYELLIPNEFKGYGSSLNNLVLIVDEETARYPWELLHDPNGISEKPMVINTGIIRQLSTDAYRKNVMRNNSDRVLIIGNPKTEGAYPSLPSAEKEAKMLFTSFENNGYDLTKSINEDEIDIVQKLHTKGYKIIHIASHGIVGKQIDDPTGVIIGKNIVYTAADFEKIRIVPEFVFINCCSSNQYDVSIAEQMHRKYDLAASVGTQLIQMGVKAAIVTGWEIDDQAALEFSTQFYTAMFNNYKFGDAIRNAREVTYNKYGRSNTWGAYQCYGDPFYTFKVGSSGSRKQAFNFFDTVEAVYTIDNLISKITSASQRKETREYKSTIHAEYETTIHAIENAIPPKWFENPEIVERFAMLYQTLSLLDKALPYYEKLFELENSGYTVKSIEQYCNTKIKHTLKNIGETDESKANAEKTLKKAIKQLEILLEGLTGKTSERYSLIAANYRRLFELTNSNVSALSAAAKYYKMASDHAERSTGKPHYYPYFNWLHLSILLPNPKSKNAYLKIPANRDLRDKLALEYANELDNNAPDFYHKTALTSFYIAGLLSEKTLENIPKYEALIFSNFEHAWGKQGKPYEKDSYKKYIQYIVSLIDSVSTQTNQLKAAKTAVLNNITSNL